MIRNARTHTYIEARHGFYANQNIVTKCRTETKIESLSPHNIGFVFTIFALLCVEWVPS